MLPFVSSMHVDTQGTHQLTNFGHTNDKKKSKVTESDHAKVELRINLTFPVLKPVRIEEYNFKSTECQKYFQDLTTCTTTLSRNFSNNKPFLKQAAQWESSFKSCLVQSFFKIRTRKRMFSETEIGKLLETRKKLKLSIITNPEESLKTKLSDLDAQIVHETQHQYSQTVHDTLGHLTGEDGGIYTHGLWSAKNCLIPKDRKYNDIALIDRKVNFITDPEGIKELCLNEMIERLRHRKMHPDLANLHKLKEMLCHKRLAIAAQKKSAPWTQAEVDKVLKSLKNNKCRDPQGLINEIFKPGSAGTDLKLSLLKLFNGMKETQQIPEMITNVNIAMIPKPGKPYLHDISNQRGIFLISVFQSMILKLLLRDEYDKIDEFMSDSNVGGRKGRRIQDHLFIVNGVVHQHTRTQNSKGITISIYDCKLCFDSLWLEHIVNDLYEAGTNDDKLSLLWQINKKNNLAVKTHAGLSQRKQVNQIVCQGDTIGSLECSLHIDEIGKASLSPTLEPYKYKGEVEIPDLGMVDDILTVSESGYKSTRLNSFINAKIATKSYN